MQTKHEHDADFVIKRGIATKNRFGRDGTRIAEIHLEDGCYRIVRLDTSTKKFVSKKSRRKSVGR
jgi:hypothetical protein